MHVRDDGGPVAPGAGGGLTPAGVRARQAEIRPVTDEDVAAAQAGCEESFALLYRHIHPGMVRYLRVLVGNEAEDVAAEAWTQVCRDLRRFHGGMDNFRGWVATIARNRAVDHLRSGHRRPVTPVPNDRLPPLPAPDDVAEAAIEAVTTAVAMRLIADLPREQAEAVLLRAVMGLDARAAGRVMGKRPGAVRTAAHRGLRTLARRLAGGPELTDSVLLEHPVLVERSVERPSAGQPRDISTRRVAGETT